MAEALLRNICTDERRCFGILAQTASGGGSSRYTAVFVTVADQAIQGTGGILSSDRLTFYSEARTVVPRAGKV